MPVEPEDAEGAAGAKSSLTVPLLFQDEVIGTFNVESPQLNAFGEEDLQFVEMFCREIASALHQLELLTAEKRSTATRSIERIGREVAMPVDEILANAAAVLDRYVGHDPEMADQLKQILASARSIKRVPLPHIGSRNTSSGRGRVSRTIAAATVGFRDAGSWASL